MRSFKDIKTISLDLPPIDSGSLTHCDAMYVVIQAFELDERDSRHKRPFNPMINEGAIVTASLLKPDLEPADVSSLLLLSLSTMSL